MRSSKFWCKPRGWVRKALWRVVIQMLVQATSGGQLSKCWYKPKVEGSYPNVGTSHKSRAVIQMLVQATSGGQLSKCWYKPQVEGSYPNAGTSQKWRAVIQMLVQVQSGGQLSQCWYKPKVDWQEGRYLNSGILYPKRICYKCAIGGSHDCHIQQVSLP